MDHTASRNQIKSFNLEGSPDFATASYNWQSSHKVAIFFPRVGGEIRTAFEVEGFDLVPGSGVIHLSSPASNLW